MLIPTSLDLVCPGPLAVAMLPMVSLVCARTLYGRKGGIYVCIVPTLVASTRAMSVVPFGAPANLGRSGISRSTQGDIF